MSVRRFTRESYTDGERRAAWHDVLGTLGLGEDEAIVLLPVAADFGVTQVVDANWGVHGSIRKSVFTCTPA